MTTLKLFNNHIRATFIFLGVIETVIFYGSVLLAVALRFGTFDFSSDVVQVSVPNLGMKAGVFALVHMLAMIALGLYQVGQFRGRIGFLQMASRIFVSLLLVSIALIVLFFIFPSIRLGRGITVLAFLFSLVAIIAVRKLFLDSVESNVFISNVLVLGVGKNAENLLSHYEDGSSGKGYKIKGFIATPVQERIWKRRAVRTRPSPGSRRSMISPSETLAYWQSEAGRISSDITFFLSAT